jgi:hypothetical protein
VPWARAADGRRVTTIATAARRTNFMRSSRKKMGGALILRQP